MVRRRLGRTGFAVSPIGFGAFKIGRNRGIKYREPYDLPAADDADRLLNAVVDLGVNFIDTAPAYGLSESRVGAALASRRREIVLCTKVGERFEEDGRSTFDFTAPGIRRSVETSLSRLRTDVVDVLLIHSDGRDLAILEQTDAVPTLLALRTEGLVRAVGFSGKTVEGARAAVAWADVLMVEYHLECRDVEPALTEARAEDVGIIVKKGLASGRLPADEAIPFVLANPAVGVLVIGGLDAGHVRDNLRIATERDDEGPKGDRSICGK